MNAGERGLANCGWQGKVHGLRRDIGPTGVRGPVTRILGAGPVVLAQCLVQGFDQPDVVFRAR